MIESRSYINAPVDVIVDRPAGSRHPKFPKTIYPVNYGYIPGTESGDGMELDAYILGVKDPLARFNGQCIAVIRRTGEMDDKLIVVPYGMELTDEEIREATHFQEQYFESTILRRGRMAVPAPPRKNNTIPPASPPKDKPPA